jgi:voltage-gated potassium channel
VFLRRLSLPVVLFAGFNLLCVLAYRRLEGLRWQDAFFWITHPHSLDYRQVHDSTKFFAIVVYFCVFAFQIWIAERVLVTIFRRPGMEAWKSMINDISLEKARDHFIVCGYGQVGRTVVDQRQRLKISMILIETKDGLYRQLLADRIPAIQGTPSATLCSPPASNARAGSASSSTMMLTTFTSPSPPAP